MAPADAIQLFEGAAEELFPAGARPHDLRLSVFVDRGFIDEARGEFGHGAIAEFALSQRVRGLFAFGDVDSDAHETCELAGGRIGDRAILHFDPAQCAVDAADPRGEFHGFAAQVAFGALETLLAKFVTLDKAHPATASVFLLAAAIDAFDAKAPFELVRTSRIHEVFVHRPFGQIGDGAIARVIQRQAAFIGFAAADVAGVRDDAAHRGIGERIDRHALEPAPGPVTMAKAIFEAIQFRQAVARALKPTKSFEHRVGIVGVKELGGVAPDQFADRITEITHHGFIRVGECTVGGLHRDDFERVFGERTQPRIGPVGELGLGEGFCGKFLDHGASTILSFYR